MDGGEPRPQRPMSTQQLDPSAMQIPVTFPVASWQQILDMLGEQKWSTVNAIMMNIHRQVQMGIQQQQQGLQGMPGQ